MKIVVVGGKAVGELLAQILIKEKHDVVVVEKDEMRAESLAEKLDALVLHGDGTDREILEDANIGKADAVVAATGDDKSNLMICEFAKEVNVPNVVARINDSNKESIFKKIGVKNTINTTAAAVLAFKRAIEKEGKQVSGLVAGGKGEIFEASIRKGSKFAGKSVSETAVGFSVPCIYRNDKCVIPKQETRIKEGDILTICSPLENVSKIEKML